MPGTAAPYVRGGPRTIRGDDGDRDGRQRAARRDPRRPRRPSWRPPARRRSAWPPCSSATIRRASATCAASSARRPRSGCEPRHVDLPGHGLAGPGRGRRRRAGRRSRRARHPRPAARCPAGLDADAVLDLIPPEKDVDGLTERSMGRLVRGAPGLVGCTPLGVMRLLERYGVETSGRRAVVVGRSTLVGLPLSLLLARKGVDATVTMAHSPHAGPGRGVPGGRHPRRRRRPGPHDHRRARQARAPRSSTSGCRAPTAGVVGDVDQDSVAGGRRLADADTRAAPVR